MVLTSFSSARLSFSLYFSFPLHHPSHTRDIQNILLWNLKTTNLGFIYRVGKTWQNLYSASLQPANHQATANPEGPPRNRAWWTHQTKSSLILTEEALLSSFITLHQSLQPLQTLHWPPITLQRKSEVVLEGQVLWSQRLLGFLLRFQCSQHCLSIVRAWGMSDGTSDRGSFVGWFPCRLTTQPSLPHSLSSTALVHLLSLSQAKLIMSQSFCSGCPLFPECSFPRYSHGSSLTFIRHLPKYHALSEPFADKGI